MFVITSPVDRATPLFLKEIKTEWTEGTSEAMQFAEAEEAAEFIEENHLEGCDVMDVEDPERDLSDVI